MPDYRIRDKQFTLFLDWDFQPTDTSSQGIQFFLHVLHSRTEHPLSATVTVVHFTQCELFR